MSKASNTSLTRDEWELIFSLCEFWRNRVVQDKDLEDTSQSEWTRVLLLKEKADDHT